VNIQGVSRRTALAVLAAAPAVAAARPQGLQVILAVDAAGRPTAPWLDAIRDRVSASELAAIAATPKPLSPDERAWADLIGEAAPAWRAAIPRLNAPFRHVAPPRAVKVVLGNQGGDDAFGVGPDVTAFDLAALAGGYGMADPAANRRLMGRLLSHEYTHLLINPYLARIGWTPDWAARDPFLAALRTLYNEGLGNLRSIEGDARWITAAGAPSERAVEALARLQPVLLDRLRPGVIRIAGIEKDFRLRGDGDLLPAQRCVARSYGHGRHGSLV